MVTVGHVDAQAESEIFVDRRGNGRTVRRPARYRKSPLLLPWAVLWAWLMSSLALTMARPPLTSVRFSLDRPGRVAVDGAGIERGRGAAGVGGAGAAGALFVDGDAVGEGVSGTALMVSARRFKPYCFHCWSNSCV